MPGPGLVDHTGKPFPSFEEGIKKNGFEKFVVSLLESASWAALNNNNHNNNSNNNNNNGEHEGDMLNQAWQYMRMYPNKVDLGKVVTGEFVFSSAGIPLLDRTFRAPAFHWFLPWGTQAKINFVNHPSVTQSVINALDNKGNSALFYCHVGHYQAGCKSDSSALRSLLADPRFLCLEFPRFGVPDSFWDARKVEVLIRRNMALSSRAAHAKKSKAMVNSNHGGCSLLHNICDESLLRGTAPVSLIRLLRSHPEFRAINHVASGGLRFPSSDHIYVPTCVAAVLFKSYTIARAKLVEALLEPHASGDESRDFRIRKWHSLAEIAKTSGYPRKIISLITARSDNSSNNRAAAVLAKPRVRTGPMKRSAAAVAKKTIAKPKPKAQVKSVVKKPAAKRG
ncbi:unnamed protein product [Polarella glacialis]|uniref:Uncharacterized protein n=1 Tax=Polarella glacialis TaxID=89957 RepID=A0A813HP30_POLGL|nr:unnamed protein product [Polarella glacialis]